VNYGALKRCYGKAHRVILVIRAGRALLSVGKLMGGVNVVLDLLVSRMSKMLELLRKCEFTCCTQDNEGLKAQRNKAG
jgi:hypothetical protein